jgi:hypothetical protein
MNQEWIILISPTADGLTESGKMKTFEELTLMLLMQGKQKVFG